MPQLKRIQAITDPDRLPGLAAEGIAIGGGSSVVQEIRAVVGQEAVQHLLGQRGIGEAFPGL